MSIHTWTWTTFTKWFVDFHFFLSLSTILSNIFFIIHCVLCTGDISEEAKNAYNLLINGGKTDSSEEISQEKQSPTKILFGSSSSSSSTSISTSSTSNPSQSNTSSSSQQKSNRNSHYSSTSTDNDISLDLKIQNDLSPLKYNNNNNEFSFFIFH